MKAASSIRREPPIHDVHKVPLPGLRISQRYHGSVGGDPSQESGLVVEREVAGVVLDLGAPVEDQLHPILGELPERRPVFARVAETRRVPFYVLRDIVVRVQDGRPELLDPPL